MQSWTNQQPKRLYFIFPALNNITILGNEIYSEPGLQRKFLFSSSDTPTSHGKMHRRCIYSLYARDTMKQCNSRADDHSSCIEENRNQRTSCIKLYHTVIMCRTSLKDHILIFENLTHVTYGSEIQYEA